MVTAPLHTPIRMYQNKMEIVGQERWNSSPRKFSSIFSQEKYSELEFAGTAYPNIRNAQHDLEKGTGVLTVGNGATTTFSNALFNMNDVQQCSVKTSLACKGMSMDTGRVISRT